MILGIAVIYCLRLIEGPLAWCIGRVLVGVVSSLGYRVLFSWGVFGVSVGVAMYFFGTGVFFSGDSGLHVNVR